MSKCHKCLGESPLGHVFCVHCGERLHLSSPTRAELEESPTRGPLRRLGTVLLAILVIVLAGTALVLWARAGTLGDMGDQAGARQVSLTLRSLHIEESVQSVGRDFREADINAYLKHLRAGQLGVEDISLAVTPGCIHLRTNTLFGPWQVGAYHLGFRLTREVELVPEGGSARVKAARIGHMPLPGPLSRLASGYFRALFADEREMLVLERLSELQADTGKVMLVVGH